VLKGVTFTWYEIRRFGVWGVTACELLLFAGNWHAKALLYGNSKSLATHISEYYLLCTVMVMPFVETLCVDPAAVTNKLVVHDAVPLKKILWCHSFK
jgi:uncharacterized membrane protein